MIIKPAMIKGITLFMFLILSVNFSWAQNVLMVKKRNSHRRYQFSEGERMKLKLKESKQVLNGKWEFEDENTIAIGGQLVELNKLDWIDVSKKEKGIWGLRKGRDLLSLAGAGYFAVTQFNNILDNQESVGNEQVLKVSTGLLAGGILCGLLDRGFRKRKLPIGRKFSVLIIR
jgi:hypothetical protein